jgi:hypothetical protein
MRLLIYKIMSPWTPQDIPKSRQRFKGWSKANPFENAFRAGALGEFMLMGLVDLVPPGLAAMCSYDMYEANECAGNAFWPASVADARLDGAGTVIHNPTQ